jgi:hypothetical protein
MAIRVRSEYDPVFTATMAVASLISGCPAGSDRRFPLT